MPRIGPLELVLILVVLLLLFGARRIPEIARSLGRSISQFRRGMRDVIPPEDTGEQEDDNEKGDTS